jgi:hypothetical protein
MGVNEHEALFNITLRHTFKSNTIGATCGAGTSYPSGTPAFSPFCTCLRGVCVVHIV